MSKRDRFRQLDEDRFDVVVVGAGIGGLTAAALLAQRGRSVLVVDQHYVAGGNATVFKRPGYEFDVGLHYLGACHPGGAIPGMLRAAGVDDVEFAPMDREGFDTLVFPGLTFQVPAGLERYRERLVETFPAERRGIDRYVRLLEDVQRIMQAAPRPLALPLALARGWLALRHGGGTLGAFLDTCTEDPALRAVLAGESGDYGQPPSRASLAMHAALMLHYLESGGWYPKGGGQVMADRLAAAIEARGGKVLLITSVERIVVEGGRAVGVDLVNKHLGPRRIHAEVVISNADLKRTLLELVGPAELPKRLVGKTRGYEMSPGLGVVYLGLEGDLRASQPNTNYWIHPSFDAEAPYAETFAQRFCDPPMTYVSMATVKDPENARLAPAGHSNVQLMGLAPSSPAAWGCDGGDYRTSERYRERKAAYAASLIAAARPVLGAALDRITFQEVATPLTHSRFTRSTGGTSYGLALTPAQFLHKRPGATTPIRGLYLCGANLRTGHGIMGAMVSGVFAAAEVAGREVIGEALAPAPEARAGLWRPARLVADP
jgi:all-trans-retinol 13,14-reductase